MTTDERIAKLAEELRTAINLVDFRRAMRQTFATLSELHAETQLAMAKAHAETQREIAATDVAVKELSLAVLQLKNSVSAMRPNRLEG